MKKTRIAVVVLLGIMLVSGLSCCGGKTTWQLSTVIEGEGRVSPVGGMFLDGDEITLTALPESGWRFDHWGGYISASENPITITMDSDKTIYVYFSSGTIPTPTPTPTGEQAYNSCRDQLQTAAVAYVAHNSSTSVDDLQIGANNILNICLLLGSIAEGLLQEVPDGCCVLNCNPSALNCDGCLYSNHYEWRIDDNGNVASVCLGAGCTAAGNGYQGVWP